MEIYVKKIFYAQYKFFNRVPGNRSRGQPDRAVLLRVLRYVDDEPGAGASDR